MNQHDVEVRYQIIASSQLSPRRKNSAIRAIGRMFDHSESLNLTRAERVKLREATASVLPGFIGFTFEPPPGLRNTKAA
jgi:hypothetical protein